MWILPEDHFFLPIVSVLLFSSYQTPIAAIRMPIQDGSRLSVRYTDFQHERSTISSMEIAILPYHTLTGNRTRQSAYGSEDDPYL